MENLYITKGTFKCTNMCCGMGEYSGINSKDIKSIDVLLDIDNRAKAGKCAHILLTAVVDHPDYTANYPGLIKCIEDNKLGSIIQTEAIVNPNSGNQLIAFLYTPYWDQLKVWAHEQSNSKKAKSKAFFARKISRATGTF